jgi:manganese/zinc/iron transport system ATP- binding protein
MTATVAATCMITELPIRARNVTVSYSGRPVLRSVSFDVPRSQMVGIVGPNGAGKTTLIKAILGLVEMDHGSVRIFSKPIREMRRHIAYVPQTEGVDWDFPVTVLDVVLMGRYARMGLLGRPQRRDREAAREAIERVGMSDFIHRHIRRLSGGQQRRVFIARALAQEAEILCLDEPFAGVDAATEQAIFELTRDLTRREKTLLIVNHDLSVLNKFDLVMLLNQSIVAMGPPRQVVTEQNMSMTYGGRLSLLEKAEERLRENVPHD